MKDYSFELHMHTAEVSRCGKISAREGIRTYQSLGYDGGCITDHFCETYFNRLGDLTWKQKIDAYLAGYHEALDEGSKLGFKVLLGMEYTFAGTVDDILVFGFDEQFLYDHEELGLFSTEILRKLRDEHNLLLIQAHPFRKMITQTYDDLVEGFEVFNGNARHDSRNEEVEEYAKRFGGIMISGSDFHQLEDAGNGGTYLPVIPEDSFELARVLRQLKTPRIVRKDRESHGG